MYSSFSKRVSVKSIDAASARHGRNNRGRLHRHGQGRTPPAAIRPYARDFFLGLRVVGIFASRACFGRAFGRRALAGVFFVAQRRQQRHCCPLPSSKPRHSKSPTTKSPKTTANPPKNVAVKVAKIIVFLLFIFLKNIAKIFGCVGVVLLCTDNVVVIVNRKGETPQPRLCHIAVQNTHHPSGSGHNRSVRNRKPHSARRPRGTARTRPKRFHWLLYASVPMPLSSLLHQGL